MAGMERLFSSSALRALPRLAGHRALLEAAAIIAVALILAALLDPLIRPPYWLALGMAIAALGIALLCAARLRLLQFAPEVLAGDVILPRPSRVGGDVKLLLPLQFTNDGGADGIIQWMALRLTREGDPASSVLLSPVAEIDMQRFIQAKRRLDDESSLEPFTAFALEGKRAIAKFVLFDRAEGRRAEPLRLLPGRYAFELFIKSTATRSHKLECTFEHAIISKHLEELASDLAVYLIDYKITLPSTRRELAGMEWLPRASARASN